MLAVHELSHGGRRKERRRAQQRTRERSKQTLDQQRAAPLKVRRRLLRSGCGGVWNGAPSNQIGERVERTANDEEVTD
jgi:hypothetical protein